jgi:hypothetical protein
MILAREREYFTVQWHRRHGLNFLPAIASLLAACSQQEGKRERLLLERERRELLLLPKYYFNKNMKKSTLAPLSI